MRKIIWMVIPVFFLGVSLNSCIEEHSGEPSGQIIHVGNGMSPTVVADLRGADSLQSFVVEKELQPVLKSENANFEFNWLVDAPFGLAVFKVHQNTPVPTALFGSSSNLWAKSELYLTENKSAERLIWSKDVEPRPFTCDLGAPAVQCRSNTDEFGISDARRPDFLKDGALVYIDGAGDLRFANHWFVTTEGHNADAPVSVELAKKVNDYFLDKNESVFFVDSKGRWNYFRREALDDAVAGKKFAPVLLTNTGLVYLGQDGNVYIYLMQVEKESTETAVNMEHLPLQTLARFESETGKFEILDSAKAPEALLGIKTPTTEPSKTSLIQAQRYVGIGTIQNVETKKEMLAAFALSPEGLQVLPVTSTTYQNINTANIFAGQQKVLISTQRSSPGSRQKDLQLEVCSFSVAPSSAQVKSPATLVQCREVTAPKGMTILTRFSIETIRF